MEQLTLRLLGKQHRCRAHELGLLDVVSGHRPDDPQGPVGRPPTFKELQTAASARGISHTDEERTRSSDAADERSALLCPSLTATSGADSVRDLRVLGYRTV